MVGIFNRDRNFFGLTYYLSGNPKKVVNLIGKYLTPVLLICIVLIFLACVFMENHRMAGFSMAASVPLGEHMQKFRSFRE